MMSWENYYFKKVEKRRNKEISFHMKMLYCEWLWGFFDMNIYTLSKLVMFSVMFLNGQGLEVASMSAFLNVEHLVTDVL